MSNSDPPTPLRIAANREFIESGEHEHLYQLLTQRLSESGWKDEIKARCKNLQAPSGEAPSMERLMKELIPHAREAVPKTVKLEMLKQIKSWLEKDSQ
ncbi:uncharacterized protein VTP21DRAFT_8437 [Calcarisporiella thermophila]|uniref:uncharacterized protein n=1 Tax=Calcarisporiella thermophila TaxID=911321 RepID=UPI003743F51D